MTEIRKLQAKAIELEREAKRVRDGAKVGSLLEGAMNHSVLPAITTLVHSLIQAGEILDAEGTHGETNDSA